jgi:hypothetical protein
VVVRKKKLRKLADLQAAPYNPRAIGQAAAGGLRRSLERFGDLSGITWNARSGHLVTGHQRVEQLMGAGAKLLGAALVLPGGERFAVRVVDWDAATEKAANVAANNEAIQGQWTDSLEALLTEIHGECPELYDELLLAELSGKLDADPGAADPAGAAEGSTAADPLPAEMDSGEATAVEDVPAGDGRRPSKSLKEFGVLVICENADHQRSAYEALAALGYVVAVM